MNNPPTSASGSSVNLAYNASSDHAEEGGFIYLRGTTGYYYLFFSAGACCGYDTSKPAAGAEYSIRVCRSASVAGPYVDASGAACTASGGTTVLASHDYVYGPGGQGILVDAAYDGAVLYYHYGESWGTSLARSLSLSVCLSWLCWEGEILGVYVLTAHAFSLSSRYQHWAGGCRLPVWLERVVVEHRLACCVLRTRLGSARRSLPLCWIFASI